MQQYVDLVVQESQRLVTEWRTPLLFVVVQLLIFLIFRQFSRNPPTASSSEADDDVFSAMFQRFPSFSLTAGRGPQLPPALLSRLRSWAQRNKKDDA